MVEGAPKADRRQCSSPSSLSNLFCDFGKITSLLWASASSFIKWACWITWSQRSWPLPASKRYDSRNLTSVALCLPSCSIYTASLQELRLKLIHSMLWVTRFCPFLSGKCLFLFSFSLPPHLADSQYTCQDDCLTLLPSTLPAPSCSCSKVKPFLSIPSHLVLPLNNTFIVSVFLFRNHQPILCGF